MKLAADHPDHATILAERRYDRMAAKAFEQACKGDSGEALHEAADLLDSGLDAWRLAMMRVARLSAVAPEIRKAFLPIWVASKMLPLSVGNRAVLARALRLLLPRNYLGEPLTLYRGATARERRFGAYGFSWTVDRNIARNFAEKWKTDGGVLLETVATPEAVLLVRKPEDYYDEGEVVLDPFRLGKVHVVERFYPRLT